MTSRTSAPSGSPAAPTVVLVHGAWADGSSWRRVVRRLLADDIAVVVVQNPTSSLADDAEATRRATEGVDGPVVLVGHSWGGTVVTEAGDDPRVKALVYVAAFAPNVGQSTADQVAMHETPPALGMVVPDRTGRLVMTERGWRENVAQDLPPAETRLLAVTAPPLAAGTFGDKVTRAAWIDRPVWYAISTQDRAVSVALQRDLARRLKANTTEISASHMSLLSQPDAVAAVIREAVGSLA